MTRKQKAVTCRICGAERMIDVSKLASGVWPRMCKACCIKRNGLVLRAEKIPRVMD